MNFLRAFFPQKPPIQIRREHGIPDLINWKIELNQYGLVATSELLPGLVTNAKTPEALLEMINDAVLEYFDVSKMESDFIFDHLDIAGQGVVFLKQTKVQQCA